MSSVPASKSAGSTAHVDVLHDATDGTHGAHGAKHGTNGVDTSTLAMGPAVARHPSDTKSADVVKCLREDGSLDLRTDPNLEAADVLAFY